MDGEGNTIEQNLPADLGQGAGQMPADMARAELASLKNDAAWVAKHLAGSEETKKQVADLCEQMSRPAAGSVISGNPSIEAQRNQMADYLAEFGPGLSPGVIEQIRTGYAETPATYAEAMSLKRTLLNDPAFVKKYMDGDHEARRKMTLLAIIQCNGVRL